MATKKSNVDKFTFWCPLDIQKAAIDPETGQEIMRLGGIASTSDEDSDGEFLDPKETVADPSRAPWTRLRDCLFLYDVPVCLPGAACYHRFHL